MKRIILPTDFSDNAYNAIRYAVKLFKDVKCTFYLLHTYTPAIYQAEYVLHSPGQIGLGDIYQENSLNQLNELKKKVTSEFNNKNHIFMVHSAFNILVDEIVETAKKENADLVIMGTQGATGAKEIFIGTNTVHVIKRGCCPILAIPPNVEFEVPKEILFPTDFEIDYQKEQLNEIMDLSARYKSKINVMHVSSGYDLNDTQLKNKAKLDSLLGTTPHLFHEEPNQEIMTAINTFQQKKQIDILAMIQNKHTFLERLFIEPIIKKLGFHETIPFLVIPSHKNN
ncbi:universal stress protein [Maribacter luteus]|uniref:universal stress protein n=1 Tax=Maribacter luteus TaxID=2594478 RepID=UPI002491263B|nr:universal stress protein [Maribacter luteus]